MQRIKYHVKKLEALLVLAMLLIANSAFLPRAFAATYTSKAMVILTNENASAGSEVIFAFTPGSTGTTLTLTFGGGTVATGQTYNGSYTTTSGTQTCQSITGASASLPGTPTAAGSSGVITFSSVGSMTSGTSYCGVLTGASAVTNPTAGVETVTYNVAGDSSDPIAVDIISNDQITVDASVPPSFTLGLSGNSDNLNALSTGSIVGTTGITATINTNAKTGWYLFGSDLNVGLKSTTENYTIASKTPGTNATLVTNSEGYLSGIPNSGGLTQGTGAGTATVATAYQSTGSGNGSGLDTEARQLVSSTGTAAGAQVILKEYATIGALTPAALDYTDTITLIGAGSF
jgi:hypothetical protein